jgi:hypothetical protein
MLGSPAYRVLSLSGHRVLARIGLEDLRHAGLENGRLQVTYRDFRSFNIDAQSIHPALELCIALGFLRITKPGRAGNGDFRTGSLYRLTYLPTHTPKSDPTDEWTHMATFKEAEAVAKAVREKYARKRKPLKEPEGKAAKPDGGKAQRRRRASADPSPTLFDALEAPPAPRVKLRVVK